MQSLDKVWLGKKISKTCYCCSLSLKHPILCMKLIRQKIIENKTKVAWKDIKYTGF